MTENNFVIDSHEYYPNRGLPKRIMEYAESLPEATPLRASAMAHLGYRTALHKALSRLARSGKLLRIFHGVYMRSIETRFGTCGPCIGKAIIALEKMWNETIVLSGGSAANRLGLTTQNPVRMVFLTSDPNRLLHVGAQALVLRHAPSWKLVAPNRKSGDLIRALAWLGPEEIEYCLDMAIPQLSDDELKELAVVRLVIPRWMAEAITARIS